MIGKHALRNALIATITILAINIGYLISGSVVIENVFAIPGLGSLLVSSIQMRDFPTISALTLLFGVLVILVNLARRPLVRPRRPADQALMAADATAPGRGRENEKAHLLQRARAAGVGPSGAGARSASGSASRSSGCSRLAALLAPLILPGGPEPPGPPQHAPAAELEPPVRHRQPRAATSSRGRSTPPGST